MWDTLYVCLGWVVLHPKVLYVISPEVAQAADVLDGYNDLLLNMYLDIFKILPTLCIYAMNIP